jgi:hypothetical protein
MDKVRQGWKGVDNGNHLAALYVQIHTLQNNLVPIEFGEVFGANLQIVCHGHSHVIILNAPPVLVCEIIAASRPDSPVTLVGLYSPWRAARLHCAR